MTQIDALADALAATSVHTKHGLPEAPTESSSATKPVKPSFASALLSAQITAPSILKTDAAPSTYPSCTTTAATSTPQASADAVSPAATEPCCKLVPVDESILQAIRKRDDRIFFSQYENQMAAFVRDPTRSTLELGAMNTYQRLLIHRCADQFQLEHQLDRATQCITLSKKPSTSHPSALLSIRAREYLVQRDGIDPVNVHPAIASLAASSAPEASVSPCSSIASTSSPASPAPSAAAVLSPPTNTPKPGFKIMRRDPSSSRHSPLRSIDNDSSDPYKASAKSRKDMTLEEREASYKAARARIFGDVVTNHSGSASPTSSTPPLDQSKAVEQVTDAATAASTLRDNKASPSSSTASSPVAPIAAGRSAPRTKKVSSSGSSVASQDGSTQRARSNLRSRPGQHSASDSANDDLEFSRALPTHSYAGSPSAFSVPQQSSPLAFSAHVAHGYFPPTHPSHLQQSHSNPNLRSRAPAFHPQGSSTPAYSQGGNLRHPDVALNGQAQPQRQWSQSGGVLESDAFPALAGAAGASSTARQGNVRSAPALSGGAWNRSQANAPIAGLAAGQEHYMNGVGVWAQQTSTYVQNNAALRQPQQQHNHAYLAYQHQQQQQQQQHQQYQPAYQPYPSGQPSFPLHYSPYTSNSYTAPRSATSSRASSQRGSGGGAHSNHRGGGARDDAVSVSSISSTASSRSASFSGVSGAGSTNASQPATGSNGSNGKLVTALSHPSLPARPAWLSSGGNVAASGAEGSE